MYRNNYYSRIDYSILHHPDLGIPDIVVDLLQKMLSRDPRHRLDASKALEHKAFDILKGPIKVMDPPKNPSQMPGTKRGSFKDVEARYLQP